jgi:cell wall-associated NlpC family hydrolase
VLIAVHDMQAISDADKRLLSTTTAHSDAAQTAKAQLDTLLAKQADLEHQADDALQQVHDALATQQQALDDANNQVRALEAALQARLDAESAARAAAMLNQARMAALAGGFADGPASPPARAAIAAASTQLGKPYVYGGSGPDVWDCSGLTQWAYRQAGVALPRTAAEQYLAVATKVPLGELEPGDLLFWATDPANPATIHHVAIYVGNAEMLAAPHTGTVVQIQPVYLDGYFGAVRPG